MLKGLFSKFTSTMRRTFEFVRSGFRRGEPLKHVGEVLKEQGFQVSESELEDMITLSRQAENMKAFVEAAPMTTFLGENQATWMDINWDKRYTFVVEYQAYDEASNSWVTKYASVQSDYGMTKEKWLAKAEMAILRGAGESRAENFVITGMELFGAINKHPELEGFFK